MEVAISNNFKFSMTGECLTDVVTLVLKDRLFASIVSADEKTIADNAVVTCGSVYYLIPGLDDMYARRDHFISFILEDSIHEK